MHSHRNRAAHLFLIAALFACGGEEEPRGMAIEFASDALFAESAQVAIYFYTGEVTCDEIRASIPHPLSVLGPYTAPVSEEARSRGVTFTLDDVPVNTYVVYVDALDSSGTIVGSGCSPNQQVFEGEISRIRVKIS